MVGWWRAGRVRRSARPLLIGLAPCPADGQAAAVRGGPQARVNSWIQAVCQGQAVGRCRVRRRAEEATRAGTVIRVRRMVAVVALASLGPVRVAAARARLNARQASTSQPAFAVNAPLGRWAR